METPNLSLLLSSPVFTEVLPIVNDCLAAGAQVYVVGGAVRDAIGQWAHDITDLDIEVHGISLDQLESLLCRWGVVRLVGKQFGVLRIDHLPIDWSVPRIDSIGRWPDVTLDPHMSITQALRRRDLTINALAYEVGTGILHDPYGGVADIHARQARYVDAQLFGQDPLRVLRVMQFIGRFALTADPLLTALCKITSLVGLSRERISQEFTKLLRLSARPSLGLRWLHATGHDEHLLPELWRLKDTPQEPSWHPEGNVLEHSWQTLDAAARLVAPTSVAHAPVSDPLVILYSALLHDIGKATTTKHEKGRWRSIGHDEVGAQLVPTCLRRLTISRLYDDAVTRLVRYHMAPPVYVRQGAKDPAYKRLAYHLAPYATAYQLALVSCADRQGRNGASAEPLTHDIPDIALFIQHMERLGVLHAPEPPRVTGDMLRVFVEPGPHMGKLLRRAYQLQLEHPEWSADRLIKEIR